jgi:cyanate permease
MAVGWVTAAVGFLGCAFESTESRIGWLIVTGDGTGVGNSGVWAITQTLAGPRAAGRWAGLKDGVSNIAGVSCPMLTGLTVDWTGGFQVAIGIAAGVWVVGAILWVAAIGEIRQVDWKQRPATIGPLVESN